MIVILYDNSGHSFMGKLELAFRAGVQWGTGMRYLSMIHRLGRQMNRPNDYEYLLALCRNEIPKSEAQDLLVQ